jgi:hypothetical protein
MAMILPKLVIYLPQIVTFLLLQRSRLPCCDSILLELELKLGDRDDEFLSDKPNERSSLCESAMAFPVASSELQALHRCLPRPHL